MISFRTRRGIIAHFIVIPFSYRHHTLSHTHDMPCSCSAYYHTTMPLTASTCTWRGKCAARPPPPPHPPPFEISASQSGCGRNFLITLPSSSSSPAFVSLFQFHMVWRRWRDSVRRDREEGRDRGTEGGMILNSVRAKSAKVCPEAHFPFVRWFLPSLPLLSSLSQWRRRRRDQPTHIDITLLFPKAPACRLPFLSFFHCLA